ncbi:hypothetical protein FOCC_FOCC008201 [Frankliniella occidentalis]|uniref:Uncharacterized protein LOC113202316 isoform X1 n=1 Tax=Frankliniella occidentalis TaxID=133901 RepID=A0A6J1RTC7_FRAOC|nr:uncharacterized protein LOC113202316 isoform X1 [Frankliniella occidentalis]KAE8745135.1 hypothetical protein FOCC_FOCC008201 [Frankliniella occidentalis]
MNFEGKTAEFITPQQVLGNIDDSLLGGDPEESVNVLLINEVKKYPILYDFNNEKYSDKEIRARIWARISEDLGISIKEAKHHWKRLRDSLRDALKRQDGKLTISGAICRKTWRYHKKMEFVIPFMTARDPAAASGTKRSRRRRNANPNSHPPQDAALTMLASGSSSAIMPKAYIIQANPSPSCLTYTGLTAPVSINLIAANGGRSAINYGSSSSNNQNNVQSSCSMQQRSLNVSGEGAAYYNGSTNTSAASSSSSSRIYKGEGVEMSLLEELAHKPLDEDLYFCLSMAASMKRLSEQRRARLKCDMMSMLYTAQCEEAFP